MPPTPHMSHLHPSRCRSGFSPTAPVGASAEPGVGLKANLPPTRTGASILNA
jgi:hypothetical protein